jgi:hypothetical protein
MGERTLRRLLIIGAARQEQDPSSSRRGCRVINASGARLSKEQEDKWTVRRNSR